METSTNSEYNLSVKTIEHLGKGEKVQTKQNLMAANLTKSVTSITTKKPGKATNQKKKHPLEKKSFLTFCYSMLVKPSFRMVIHNSSKFDVLKKIKK